MFSVSRVPMLVWRSGMVLARRRWLRLRIRLSKAVRGSGLGVVPESGGLWWKLIMDEDGMAGVL